MFDRHAMARRLDHLADLFGSARALSAAAGLSGSHVTNLSLRMRQQEDPHRGTDVGLATILQIARAAKVSPVWVAGLGYRLGDHRDWAGAVEEGRRRWPEIPAAAWTAAAEIVLPPDAPKRLQAEVAAAAARLAELTMTS